MEKLKLFFIAQIGFSIASIGLLLFTDIETRHLIANQISLSLGYIACLINPSVTVNSKS